MTQYIYLIVLLTLCTLSIVGTIKLNKVHYKSYDNNTTQYDFINENNENNFFLNKLFESLKQEVIFYVFIVKKYTNFLFVPLREFRQNIRNKIEHLKY